MHAVSLLYNKQNAFDYMLRFVMDESIGKKYQLFLMGNEAKTDGVGIFVAEKWADSVERHSERILVLKMVLGDRLLNVFSVYASHTGKPEEEKESFWDNAFHLVSCIPQNEMVVFAGI